jgi:hypothetical protein
MKCNVLNAYLMFLVISFTCFVCVNILNTDFYLDFGMYLS